uniref:Protein kinase domain-containing protein n=1 Tax=Meloidogyne javanica TaxID=6303 RepID=A0A915MZS6_MELJA
MALQTQRIFNQTLFVEVNSHSLFSKWFSESGKLIQKLFSKIEELAERTDRLIFVLIDEVESLTIGRETAFSGNDPTDSIRAVNAMLTQLDRLKRFSNVFIICTSNIERALDAAFVDRIGLSLYFKSPTLEVINSILTNCIDEMKRVKGLFANDGAKLSGRALRKLPTIAYSIAAQNLDENDYGSEGSSNITFPEFIYCLYIESEKLINKEIEEEDKNFKEENKTWSFNFDKLRDCLTQQNVANGSLYRSIYGFGQSTPAISIALQRARDEHLIDNVNFTLSLAIKAVLTQFNWFEISLIYVPDNVRKMGLFFPQDFETVISNNSNFTIVYRQQMDSTAKSMKDTLLQLQNRSRIVVAAFDTLQDRRTFLLSLYDLGIAKSNEYVDLEDQSNDQINAFMQKVSSMFGAPPFNCKDECMGAINERIPCPYAISLHDATYAYFLSLNKTAEKYGYLSVNLARNGSLINNMSEGEFSGGKRPLYKPICGYTGTECPQNITIYILIGVGLVLLLLVATLGGIGYAVREKLKEKERLTRECLIPFGELKNIKELKSNEDMRSLEANKSLKSLQSSQSGSTKLTSMDDKKLETENYVHFLYNREVVFAIKYQVRVRIFNEDFILLRKIRQLDHDNLNKFCGLCVDAPILYAIWKHCQRGSLKDLIAKEQYVGDSFVMFTLMRDIASGLIALHKSFIGAHGMLSSENCLINDRWQVKISDFGLNMIRESQPMSKRKLLWTAPE